MKYLSTFLIALVATLGLAACEVEEGPVEEAGETVDQTVEDTEDAAENAADDVEDAVD